jgi:hypothetical protein
MRVDVSTARRLGLINPRKKSWENPRKIGVAPPQNEFFMGNLKKARFGGGQYEFRLATPHVFDFSGSGSKGDILTYD